MITYDQGFIKSVCEFVNTAMETFTKQKELNVLHNTELNKHLTVIQVQQAIIKDLSTQLLAHKVFITEHEGRIKDLEQVIKYGDVYSVAKYPVKAN